MHGDPPRPTPRRRGFAPRRGLAWAAALLLPLLPACDDESCTLERGPLFELHLGTTDNTAVARVHVEGSFEDTELPMFGCGDPDITDTGLSETCLYLWVPLPESTRDGVVQLVIEAEGYEPKSIEHEVLSDGCHLRPDQRLEVPLVPQG
ncbi:MAG: hypothetical protein K1X88_09440 [Nannocystaceae bacterium]|nr:hypothetical protein [Nannocystaceae bacterium]